MTQAVRRSIVVRRDVDTVAELVSDPHRVLALMPGFARCAYLGDAAGGEQEWDVFLDVGTLHIGGRVLLATGPHGIRWEALRGTRHTMTLDVEPLDLPAGSSRLTMAMEYGFSGLLAARVAEVLGRGIAARHLDAGLEQIRHHLEHETP